MSRKECAFGFSCSAMLMQPGLEAEQCPNKEVCGLIIGISPEEEIELIIARGRAHNRQLRRVWLTAKEASNLMLMNRGCPQTSETLQLDEAIGQLRQEIESMEETISTMNGKYIAPIEAKIHTYNVKRPYGVYDYNKLVSVENLFEPAVREGKVKTIHLSKNRDFRHILAREGIVRRNRLQSLLLKIENFTSVLQEARGGMEEVAIAEQVSLEIDRLELQQE